MFEPRLRKVLLKRALDASLYRGVARAAAAVVVASDRERDSVVAGGIDMDRVRVRGNGFPSANFRGPLHGIRSELGIPEGASIVLYVGRLAAGKGIDHLQEAARRIPDAHFVFVGPDDQPLSDHRALAFTLDWADPKGNARSLARAVSAKLKGQGWRLRVSGSDMVATPNLRAVR